MSFLFSSLVIFTLCFAPAAHAGKIEDHRRELKSIIADTDQYEKRMNELKSLKEDTQEGPTLDAIVNEIAELQKKLLQVKHRKTVLTEHLRLEHPNDSLLTEMALIKKPEDKDAPIGAKNTKLKLPAKEDGLDQRLNHLLTQVQSQYNRTAHDRDELGGKAGGGEAMVIDVSGEKKRRQILQKDKDKYLKETLNSKIQVKPTDAPVEAPTAAPAPATPPKPEAGGK